MLLLEKLLDMCDVFRFRAVDRNVDTAETTTLNGTCASADWHKNTRKEAPLQVT